MVYGWMMDRAMKIQTISEREQVNRLLNWADRCICSGLEGGAVDVAISRHDPNRNNEQNKKGWALWTDISNQLTWYGNKLSPEEWKDLLSHEWKAQKIVPGISGGFCALGVRTSKMKKREFSELIEITYAFGATNGVVWSEAALKQYESYRENQ